MANYGYFNGKAAVTLTLVLTGSVFVMARPARNSPTARTKHPWWHNPCAGMDSEISEPTKHKIRHNPRGIDFKPLITQFEIVQSRYEDALEELKRHYSPAQGVGSDQFKQNWLKVPRIPEMRLRARGNKQKIKKQFPPLHTRLQRFGATFESMIRMQATSSSNALNSMTRSRVLGDIIKHARALLCEVETTLNNSQVPLPARQSANFMSTVPSKSWNPRPDLTLLYVQDWGVFLAYKEFLTQDLNKVVKSLTAKGTGNQHNPAKGRKLRRNPLKKKPKNMRKKPNKSNKQTLTS